MATKWGICSAGKISSDFCTALQTLPRDQHQIVAVAARSLEDAQEFATLFNIPKAYGSYDELAQDDDIDVAYVSTIHPYHHAAVQLLLSHQRNILCEKPLTLTLKGAQELIQEAKTRGVFFMEGYWARCFPVYDEIRKHLREGTLGEVKMVAANICLPLDQVARIRQRSLGGGGLMDIGCYAVQAANLVFPGLPEEVGAQGTFYEEGTDCAGCITLKYSGGRLASLAYSTAVEDGANRLCIMGSKGSITVPGHFWCPDRLSTPSGEKVFDFPPNDCTFIFDNSIGFIYEIQAVRKCLQQGLKECPVIPHSDTEAIMSILQQVQKLLGISYDQP